MAEAFLLRADLFAPANEMLSQARAAAEAAIAADPSLADGHVAMGMVRVHADLDWAGAEAGLRKAIALNPHLAAAYGWLGWLLSATGRTEEGLRSSRKAVELEPRSPLTHALLAANLYFAADYGASFDEAGRALEIDPQFHLALFWRGMSMIARGLPGLVAGRLEEARKTNSSPVVLAALARAYAANGKQEKARAALAELEEAARSRHVSPILIASIHAALGDSEKALDWLETAYQGRAKLLLWVKQDPVYAGLRKSGRFQALVAKMKL
jgi:tetratricopeptide (TPR) repeat protein